VQITYNPTLALSKVRSAEINDKIKVIAIEILKRKKLNKAIFEDKNHFLIYKRYFKGYPALIKLSNSYIVVENLIPIAKRKCRYWCSSYYEDNNLDKKVYAYKEIWVLGLDTNNKVFVNLLNRIPADYYIKNITPIIEIHNDEFIRDYHLGFNYNVGDNEKIVIDIPGRYRVQGEIVYEFAQHNYEDIISYMISKIMSNINPELFTLVNTYLAFKIRNYLLSLGFSDFEISRLDNSDLRITIRNIYYSKDFDKKLNKLRNLIIELLKDDIMYTNSIVVRESYAHNSRYRHIEIITSNNYAIQYIRLVEYIKNELHKYISELIHNKVKKEYTVYIGNHKIRIESLPLEYNIEIPNELNPVKDINPEYVQIINSNIRDNIEFFVLEGFSSTISHNVHGIGNIEFKEEGILRLTTTVISDSQFRYQNQIAFSQL